MLGEGLKSVTRFRSHASIFAFIGGLAVKTVGDLMDVGSRLRVRYTHILSFRTNDSHRRLTRELIFADDRFTLTAPRPGISISIVMRIRSGATNSAVAPVSPTIFAHALRAPPHH